jgi:hypothetical protein
MAVKAAERSKSLFNTVAEGFLSGAALSDVLPTVVM